MITRREDIENAVRQMTQDDLAAFREWFARFDADAWDRQLEDDVARGRLDALADESVDDLRQGRCKDL